MKIGRIALYRIFLMLLKVKEPGKLEALLRKMAPEEVLLLDALFEAWASEGQLPPGGEGWRTWLMIAGRGFGKTRAGAEWVQALATRGGMPVRIALVGATEAEVRAVMVEGPSGILKAAWSRHDRPLWEPSVGRLKWKNGSEAYVYSGENPDGLRGPNHHYAWCDELAKWAQPEATWDNLRMSLRCGERPRALITTTPRPIAILKKIMAEPWTAVTRGKSGDNVSNPDDWVKIMAATYGGTRLGRQEIDGEIVEDHEDSLWPRETIERARCAPAEPEAGRRALAAAAADAAWAAARAPVQTTAGGWIVVGGKGPAWEAARAAAAAEAAARAEAAAAAAGRFARIVVGVDPPASAHGDACGIVVCGLGHDGTAAVLEDATVAGRSPDGWAKAVVAAAERWDADKVVAEANQGGEMVETVLRAARADLPVKRVVATRGKSVRAEPVAALFENGRAKFAGRFPELEDQLAGMIVGGAYRGPGRSPDRADACVWAMTELMVRKQRAAPRVLRL
jgi:phage terminase large subunit-like protein